MTVSAETTGANTSAPLQLEAVIEGSEWPECVTTDAFLAPIAGAIAAKLDIDRPEVAVVAFTDDAAVQTLNARYRGKNQPTNVLSFPAGDAVEAGRALDQPWPLGDIALARETVLREAASQNIDFSAHTTHLIVHGVLHLFGYDHCIDQDAEEMEALEIEILADLGLSNPYTEKAIGSD